MTQLLPQHEDPILDDLVVRAKSERDSFGQLYDRIYPPLFRYCIRRTSQRSLAEDIASTVFLSVVNKITTFPGETFVEFRRWIYVIATNEINANHRKSARRQNLLIEAATSGRLQCMTNNETATSMGEIDAVQAAIMQLPERDQSVVTLRYFSELSYEDIGHILNISPGAARTAASRALNRISIEVGRKQ